MAGETCETMVVKTTEQLLDELAALPNLHSRMVRQTLVSTLRDKVQRQRVILAGIDEAARAKLESLAAPLSDEHARTLREGLQTTTARVLNLPREWVDARPVSAMEMQLVLGPPLRPRVHVPFEVLDIVNGPDGWAFVPRPGQTDDTLNNQVAACQSLLLSDASALNTKRWVALCTAVIVAALIGVLMPVDGLWRWLDWIVMIALWEVCKWHGAAGVRIETLRSYTEPPVPYSDRALLARMNAAEREAQRRSFVYGTTKLANDHVTEDMVNEIGEELAGNSEARRACESAEIGVSYLELDADGQPTWQGYRRVPVDVRDSGAGMEHVPIGIFKGTHDEALAAAKIVAAEDRPA